MIVRMLQSFVIFFFFTSVQIGYCQSSNPEKPSRWDQWTFDKKVSWRGKNLDPRIPYEIYVDKLKVKEIVGKSILTAKTLFATDDLSSITTQGLPSKYLMKANNASGRGLLINDGMLLARMKRDFGFVPMQVTDAILVAYAKKWLTEPYRPNDELQYSLVKPMILFEEYLENITMDIELFCFNGKVQLIEVLFIEAYKSKPIISFYDSHWNLLETTHPVHEVRNKPIDRPIWLDQLFDFAQQYTQNIDQVRIDFYLNGKDIYFGEFTFTTGSGVVPSSFQEKLGHCWKFPEVNQ